ncbi:MAG: Alpha-xylosidase BoGH31A [Candidatus Marinimicrobia bacterium]|nr:Alpha-xylosidase BoGH31A [Candidatus Neomarinimicrobiota bacterium]
MKNWIPVLFGLLLVGNIAFPVKAPDNDIKEGNARFQVITPMVIRMEYAPDGNFENRQTFFVINRTPQQVDFETSTSDGWRFIETSKISLQYRQNSGAFSDSNLVIQLKAGPEGKKINPIAASKDSIYRDANLGGWRHDLGFVKGSVDLYDGLLNRNGWYLFDDSETAVWNGAVDSSWVEPRNTSEEYQDLYFFGYDHQYKQALRDFADLTGHPPMLPRWAFGIWFSRLEDYGADDFRHHILPQMREHRIPLDALIIDTDWKTHSVRKRYNFPNQYLLGEDMLVAPIASPGDTASQLVWFPSGEWVNYFTGEKITGPKTQPVAASLETMPVYVKAGSIIPMQPYMDYVGQKPVEPLKLRVFASADGEYELYEDSGTGLKYREGNFAWTKFTYSEHIERTLTIYPPEGEGYSGMPKKRGYEIEFVNVEKPDEVMVKGALLNSVGGQFSYDRNKKKLTVPLPPMPVSEPVRISLE